MSDARPPKVSIICAPFHPDLEEALVSEVQTAKRSYPLRPLAILVPSQQLARRVKWLLAVERQAALLDVHILTFHQLAMTILRENVLTAPPELVNTAFREELLRSLVNRELPGLEPFREWVGMRGLWRGIWATIQDLKEARIDPASALSALDEGLLGKDDPARLRAFLQLYQIVLATDDALRTADPDDLARLAVSRVSSSTFLARMDRIVYYGFYDLTQGQLDLFQAITRGYSATVYFPLQIGNANYRFAQQFYDSYIAELAGAKGAVSAVRNPPHRSLADEMLPHVRGACRIFSAVGLDEEVSTVAKEIVRLVEDQKMEFVDIGLVARTLDPVLPVVRKVFAENRIPYACAVGEPLIHQPLVKSVVQFIGLQGGSFPRAAVLDVLTSPFCRVPALLSTTIPWPDQWDWITRRLNITKGNLEDGGLGDWLRLEAAATRQTTVPSDSENGRVRAQPLSTAQVELLWRLVNQLHTDLSALPRRAGWGDYTTAFMEILASWFELSAWRDDSAAGPIETVQLAVKDCLLSVQKLDLLHEEIGLQDWCDHVIHILEAAKLPSETQDLAGVKVLDAMAARGVRFRALFIIGLNEKAFPRSIQEDAFLRDADREILSRDLGYKIPRKLDGFDEERLLFALLLRSAQERLYLSYQRGDQNGRALSPSGYLAEIHPHVGSSFEEFAIRRRPMERWISWPCDSRLLSAQEMGLYLILQNGFASRTVADALNSLGRPAVLFDQGLCTLANIDGTDARLSAYDGFIGEGLPASMQKPLSPTALERYARCPFQYYAAQVLRLAPLRAPESVSELEARACGELCHRILRGFYERLHGSGLTVPEMLPLEALEWLSEEAASVFAEYERTEAIGYRVLWDVTKEEIFRLVEQLVLSDLIELSESGYHPSFFELEVAGELDLGRSLDTPVMIRGVLDRVDLKKTGNKVMVRVVDYKYTQASALLAGDRDLTLAAMRARRLQPALYLQLAKNVLPDGAGTADSAAFYFLGAKWADTPIQRKILESSCWAGETGVVIKKSLGRIVEGIQQGRFSILPGDYCKHCDFGSACRYTHDATGRRARTDPVMKLLKTLRTLKLAKEQPVVSPSRCDIGDVGEERGV